MSKVERQQFRGSDPVTWTSGANGGTKAKFGIVVEVVPPHKYPRTVWAATGHAKYGPFRPDGNPQSMPRDHESYIVLVRSVKGCPRYYWPVVSKLRRTE